MTTVTAPGGGRALVDQPIRRKKLHRTNWWLTALVAVLSLTILVPLYFTIVTAFKIPTELAESGFALPSRWTLKNFQTAWTLTSFPKRMMTSAIVTVGAVVLTLLSNSFVSYAISRNMHRKWVKALYFYFIAAMFVPFPIIMLPVVKDTALLGIDNEAGLILLYVVFGLSFNMMLYTSYLKSMPEEIEESASIDGAGRWTVFWKIVFPLLAPMNATVGILTCVWAWNDFLLPLVILTDPGTQTLPLAQYVFQGQFNTNYTVAFASYLLAMAPMLIVYIFSQKWVISGVMRGSSK
ncbi:MAG: carbohydrate ABC transporter permease [Acidipropionibacterium acidipropionici]|jgi:raffinose/stachyose/melibiose transport system permease protein|uniref:Sugar ABC superfamily ATP binding cassette transporter, membrane protein n=1 Tax=Acidipropionibacterium acidipropionici (strain ATCC 4875 / DSM 20272 / JCM 6432 / NBRC 12425 / NCIMB 8070 / 4) TaxID=1171373 RepID=K7RQG2_ACIA4|nr:carbohydrate ABC transporter permease [Acidipropionibacterium acidipropionici]AFV88531.1 Sugar ABC superfamily ATP binding cassette transporter, membrane protein [Acidipropionibacterium acidipropionici ATCC 4875]